MIKIINGEFGYNDGASITVKTPKDDPFCVSEELERRLVAEGIAAFVSEQPAKKVEDETNNIDGPYYNNKTNYEELKAIAIRLGATDEDLKGKKSKADIRALIDELIAPRDDESGNDDCNDGNEESGGESNNDTQDAADADSNEENQDDEAPDLGNDDGVVD